MSGRERGLWKVISETPLYDASPFIRLSAQCVELPDGRRIERYYQLKMPDIASVYAETPDGRIVVLRSYRHGVRRICLGVPGGHIDEGEAPLEAARRELREETGYEAAEWRLLGSYITNANHRCQTAYYFKATGCRPVAAPDSGDLEDSEVVVLTRDELLAALRGGEFPFVSQVALFALAFGYGTGAV
jgi:ADP-ribose pyrophosphatase